MWPLAALMSMCGAILAGLFAFSGVTPEVAGIATVLFWVILVVFVISTFKTMTLPQ